ncbi:MAG TPA: ATP-binding cassette domain-containing protein [Fimbriimonadaceae bacterium]|nr:ATP-binding cassette domain-containing protein [Fimbriimonadaceae bacterium]
MPLLQLRDLSLEAAGPGLTFNLERGKSLAIMGPSGSGKTALLRCLLGIDRPARGSARLSADAAVADPVALPRRITPQTIARKAGASPSVIAEALSATRLWDQRFRPLRELSSGQTAACAVLEVLSSPQPVLAVDGQLDLLDPWALSSTLDLFRERLRSGRALLFATNRPDVAREADLVAVVANRQIRFSGTVEVLRQAGPATLVRVSTSDEPGVRALVEPFEVSIQREGEFLELRARDGQAVAAKLLVQGYGDVSLVQLREPSVEEALLALLA